MSLSKPQADAQLAEIDDYLFAGPLFRPPMALANGAGYILCGLWMRRA